MFLDILRNELSENTEEISALDKQLEGDPLDEEGEKALHQQKDEKLLKKDFLEEQLQEGEKSYDYCVALITDELVINEEEEDIHERDASPSAEDKGKSGEKP